MKDAVADQQNVVNEMLLQKQTRISVNADLDALSPGIDVSTIAVNKNRTSDMRYVLKEGQHGFFFQLCAV